MPSLKDLSCSIELSGEQKPLPEFGTVYGDAVVETFIPIPQKQQAFTIHLSSKNFIAPGIAMYVFIDGVYQCNRNRQNLKLRQPPDRRSLVDFRVRQKEERQEDGSMIAREWTFKEFDHAPAGGAPASCSPNVLDNAGCIEVVVLRCAGSRNATKPANMNLDGATDYPNYHLDRDSRSRATAWDDRDLFISAGSNKHGPPPPVPAYRSPYVETVRSHRGTATQHQRGSSYGRELSPLAAKKVYSRFSEPVSPGTRPRDIPAPGFQYGSGPLPPHSSRETHRQLVENAMQSGSLGGVPTVDPTLLEEIVRDAVKRGVEQSRRKDTPDGSRVDSRRHEQDTENSSQVPGAWPTPPTRLEDRQSRRSASANYNRDHDRNDHDSTWERHSSDRKHRPTGSRAGTRVAWDEDVGWDKQSRADEWGSSDNPAESWDAGETWSRKPSGEWEEVRRRSRSRRRITRSPSPRRASHASNRTSNRRRSSYSRSQKSRSTSRARKSQWPGDTRSSSEDNDGWTHVDAPSDSTTSLERSDSTLQPSHSRSQVQARKNKSTRRSSQRASSHKRAPAQLIKTPQWHPESAFSARPPSVLVTNAPTLVSAPPPHHPSDIRPRRQSTHTQAAAPTVAPPPTWGCASETARKNSVAARYLPPAPFSTIGDDRAGSRRSSGSSSWGVTCEKNSKQATWGMDPQCESAQSAWGEVETRGEWNAEQSTGWGGSGVKEKDSDGWNDDNVNNDECLWSQEPIKPTTTTTTARRGKGKKRDTLTLLPSHHFSPPQSQPQPRLHPPSHPLKIPSPTLSATNPKNKDKNENKNKNEKEKKRTSHLSTNPGTPYGHAVNRPVYLDGLGDPYAVFRFRCRGWSGLGRMGKEGRGVVGKKKEEGDNEDAGKWTEEWVRLHS